MVEQIKQELQKYVEPEKAAFLPKFFQAGPGGYAEGDEFIGVRVPRLRQAARKYYRNITLIEIAELLHDPVHEYRAVALMMLASKYEKADPKAKEEIAQFYLDNLDYVNNWDLVDLSADKILGAHLFAGDRRVLYELAASKHLWRQRAAVMATFYFIRHGEFSDTFRLAELLIGHPHHLIHKAVGWMLREVGKRDQRAEVEFLKAHYQRMPRTMLRYAIEKLEPGLRRQFLEGRA